MTVHLMYNHSNQELLHEIYEAFITSSVTNLTCRSTILLPTTFPFITCAPVLIAFNTHFTDISDKLFIKYDNSLSLRNEDKMADTTLADTVRATEVLAAGGYKI